MTRIVRAVTYDVRFPTSLSGAGSDAMNPDPDYSAAYVALETDDPGGLTGHGLTFTIGRGTELCVGAIEALAPHVVGYTIEVLRRNEATKAERELVLLERGFPAYTTSAGWLGYAEETLHARVRDALEDGFTHLKLKVGAGLET